MPIPERQLKTWSELGAVSESQDTLNILRLTLGSSKAPARTKFSDVMLQGSYHNRTLIFGASSDVDILLLSKSQYSSNLEESVPIIERFIDNSPKPVPDSNTYDSFKMETFTWLQSCYGNDVRLGSKAIYIKGGEGRRPTDVLPCFPYRKYFATLGNKKQAYIEGISFWLEDGSLLVNYPMQHAENGARKQKRTSSYYKPMVRLLKNMRDHAKEVSSNSNKINAPSYFIEGLLYNAPDNLFGGDLARTFLKTMTWLAEGRIEDYSAVNEQDKLVHPWLPVSWRLQECEDFIRKMLRLWDDWK